MKKKYILISIAVVLIGVGVYLGITLSEPTVPYTYQLPENINDGIDVGNLDEVNIDSELIEKAVTDVRRGKYGAVHSMIIFKDGKLVLEEYFEGYKFEFDASNHRGELVTWNRSMLHYLASGTKSIVSICIGIAIDKGFIESVHQSIFDYLPEHQHLNTDGKDKISIEHLLTMTSGLEWDEWSAPPSSRNNDILEIWFQDAEEGKDPLTYILEKPLVTEPGTSFIYSGGNMIVLGEIIRNATNMYIDEFSTKYLFEPLGIDSTNWTIRYTNGVIETAGSFEIRPRDMTKIGVTFLNNGVWNGTRIISEQWVGKSATTYSGNTGINVPNSTSGRRGYSYTWWTKQYSEAGKEVNMFFASGWGGQEIMVLPETNTVVVFTGGAYTSTVKVFKILENYILPAVC